MGSPSACRGPGRTSSGCGQHWAGGDVRGTAAAVPPGAERESCSTSSYAACVQVTHNGCGEDFFECFCLAQRGSWFLVWEWFGSQNSASEAYCSTDIIMT